jgi:hypothetical protein
MIHKRAAVAAYDGGFSRNVEMIVARLSLADGPPPFAAYRRGPPDKVSRRRGPSPVQECASIDAHAAQREASDRSGRRA